MMIRMDDFSIIARGAKPATKLEPGLALSDPCAGFKDLWKRGLLAIPPTLKSSAARDASGLDGGAESGSCRP